MGDISNNLVEWAVEGNTVYYRTEKFWYMFHLDDGLNIIRMTRFDDVSWVRNDTWMNVSSGVEVGRDWLLAEPQKSKRVELFINS